MGESIDLRDIFNAIKIKIKFILIITIIAMIIGCIYSFCLIEPEYQTNTTLLIKNNVSDSSKISSDDIDVSQKLAVTYGEIIKSRAVLNEVIKELNLKTSYEELISCISVSTLNDTEIINVTVKYNDSKKVYKIANKLNQVFYSKAELLGNEENIEILDSPVIPTSPINTSPIKNIAIATSLGLIISLFVIFIKAYFDDKITRIEDVEKYIKLSLLGVIPHINKNKKLENDASKFIKSEAFREIRTNIEFSNVDNNIKSVLVTSTKGQEGKTTIVSQLALCFAALENKKIFLIDCNLRNPGIHKEFNIANSKGLVEILTGKNSIEECINYVDIPNSNNQKLHFITAGKTPLNPSELLSTKKMINLLNVLKNEYDYVFIDSPSIETISDASIVSNIVDGTILVIGLGETNIKNIEVTKEKLLNAKANIIGAILNKIK